MLLVVTDVEGNGEGEGEGGPSPQSTHRACEVVTLAARRRRSIDGSNGDGMSAWSWCG
jgi:hypothetical protein